jgi:hypothetical protein
MPQCSSIEMPSRAESKRVRLESRLRDLGPVCIDETVWMKLLEQLAPISAGYLRKLLKTSGVPLSPIVEGVRQESLDEAARTLLALARLFIESDLSRRKRIRAIVIESKDRLRWALKRMSPEVIENTHLGKLKEEILLWTMTWLENPELFETWLSIRRAVAGSSQPTESGLNLP